mmetsp:Transcript_64244/g.198886  ORF Transcript_64244/g.198886 Transcript_64244/m.198886 type:complete len:200 (+) Transcript_64244:176-775(+)
MILAPSGLRGRPDGGICLVNQGGELEGPAARLRQRDHLLEHHLLGLGVRVVAAHPVQRVDAEGLVGHGLPVGVEARPEQPGVLLPHLAKVGVPALVQDRDLLVYLDELQLLEEAVVVEVVKTEQVPSELLEALRLHRARGLPRPPDTRLGGGRRLLALLEVGAGGALPDVGAAAGTTEVEKSAAMMGRPFGLAHVAGLP